MLMSKMDGRPFLRQYAPAADDGNGDGVPYFCAKSVQAECTELALSAEAQAD